MKKLVILLLSVILLSSCSEKTQLTGSLMTLIKEKNKNILFSQKDGKTIYSILTGPYGNYIKIETPPKKPHNIKFPNAVSLDGITLDKIKEIIAQPVKRVYKKKIKLGLGVYFEDAKENR